MSHRFLLLPNTWLEVLSPRIFDIQRGPNVWGDEHEWGYVEFKDSLNIEECDYLFDMELRDDVEAVAKLGSYQQQMATQATGKCHLKGK